ncbi:hypothetical protein [Flavobacterium sp.]|uniref:hypothetical protein n=1 Tax=Flavobacterium sp. TaxID=239 RepID=UPI002FDB66F2
MKIRAIFYLYLFLSNYSFSQYNSKVIDSVKTINIKSESKDSIKDNIYELKDTLVLNKKSSSDNSTIIYLKNTDSTDYFKYIFPIITLLLGIGINKLIDYNNKRNKIKKSGKRWLSELQVLGKPIENQISNIDAFLLEHEKEIFAIPNPRLITTLDCEIFSSLDKSELVEYLLCFKKNKDEIAIENSNSINGFITILKSHNNNYRIQFEQYKNNVSSFTTSLSKNLQILQRKFVTYGILLEEELGFDPINDLRYKPILDLFNSEILPYLNDGNYDIFKLEKSFFLPLIKILSNLRLDPRIQPMFEYSKNCVVDIKGIKMEKHYLSVNFKTLKDWYIESKTDLPEIINLLK